MHIEDYSRLIQDYLREPIIETVSPSDKMYSGDRVSYLAIGKSAVAAILPVMFMAPRKSFGKILDFGCGYGRVGRHLRALFKDSQLYFTDIKQDAVDFCASTFSGVGFESSPDFNSLDFPTMFDLIWVGSVFTHIDHARQKLLFRRLSDALLPGGALIVTFHGRRCLEIKKSGAEAYIEEGRWNRIVSGYYEHGIGYERYGREDLGDWGVSLNSIESMTALSHSAARSRIIALSEAGWANHQDVIAYTVVSKSA